MGMICIIGIPNKSMYNACNSKYNNRYDRYNSRYSGRDERYNSRCNSRYEVRIIHIIVGIIVIVGINSRYNSYEHRLYFVAVLFQGAGLVLSASQDTRGLLRPRWPTFGRYNGRHHGRYDGRYDRYNRRYNSRYNSS